MIKLGIAQVLAFLCATTLCAQSFADQIQLSLLHDVENGVVPEAAELYDFLWSADDRWSFFRRHASDNHMICSFVTIDTKSNTVVDKVVGRDNCGTSGLEDAFEYYNGTFFEEFLMENKKEIGRIIDRNDLKIETDYSNVRVLPGLTGNPNYLVTLKTPSGVRKHVCYDGQVFFIDATTNSCRKE